MKSLNWRRLAPLIMIAVVLSSSLQAKAKTRTATDAFSDSRFSINFRNTPLNDALELIAAKGHLNLNIEEKMTGKVNYAIRNSTLEEALQQISDKNALSFSIDGHTLTISKRKEAAVGGTSSLSRQPASDEAKSPLDSGETESPGGLTYRSIPVMYANARELSGSLSRNLQIGESVVADESNNVLVLFSSPKTYKQVKSFIDLYDRRPAQILIEAQIVETTKSFARDLGVSWGNIDAASGRGTIGISNPSQANPNFTLNGLLGAINGRVLEAKLVAAETNGDAKIVSHPKVFALNNKKATIHSGITYSIKTLSAVTTAGTSGSTSTPTAVTGGVVSISSGLQLDVTPTVVGEGLVRLVVKVTNSEPDKGAAVDGIPGINDNSADTSILVRGGETATLAGLMKNAVANTQSGVPWISRVPVLGWLFSSRQKSEETSELMIFLTPHILDPLEKPAARLPASAPGGV
jgi:type IV pilus assembly protein PilQ